MDVRLDGKVAVITGASRGIGLAMAQRFSESGAQVVISSRKAEDLHAAATTLSGEVATVAGNAGSPDDLDRLVTETMDRFGRIDVLVNNAATCPYVGPLMEVDLPRWDKTFEVNVRGPLLLAQKVWGAWMSEHGGSILNVVSIGGFRSNGFNGVYDNSKAALIQQTKHLATELGPKVRVNGVAPGLVETDMAKALIESRGAEIASRTPMRRNGVPDDVAAAALFLSSDLASWITGQVLLVDGGRVAAGAA